ncbi:hypothetical protein GTQ40_13320 [Flavobacteriaceae bacterium R38]|nr:hypothetical protein [Flavobacteriaceae bacterium R38]
MKKTKIISIVTGLVLLSCSAQSTNEDDGFAKSDNLKIVNTSVVYDSDIEHLIFEIKVKGTAGKSLPKPVGQLDGAPVLGYVFPTNLKATDVGFSKTDGIVALALTSHPDFDDTPLWDENANAVLDDDGIIWHPHWVVLHSNKRVPGGLSVKQYDPEDKSVKLPPTNPGMPMYMDSPGYAVITKGNSIKVLVPKFRIMNKTDFSFDGVAAYMQVNTSNTNKPLLGVYAVYSVASGDLSLPFKTTIK